MEADLRAWHRSSAIGRRLAEIPGVGPIGAALLAMKVPDPGSFKSARHFAAWLGLTPKDHSTAGRQRHGGITRAGDAGVRATLVVGAMAVVKQILRGRGGGAPAWLVDLLARKPPKLAAVAFANKIARIAWTMLVTGDRYDPARGAGSRKAEPAAA